MNQNIIPQTLSAVRNRVPHCPAATKYCVLILLALLTGMSHADINVYSARQENLIKPLLDNFTAQTGIQTRLLTAKADALLERIKLEGENSPADVLITTDVARLHRAKELGLLQRVKSDALTATIPAAYRDEDNQWFGLSLRARVIVAAKDRVRKGEVTDYESLAKPEWKQRVCARSSGNVYNQSLVASIIYAVGEREALRWIKGLVSNFARPPAGGDRDQILLVAGGQCDVALVNTYYFGMMLAGNDTKRREAAEGIALIWPGQSGRGAHVNVSGAGILRSSQRNAEATKLLEYLIGREAQTWYSRHNYEYPIRADVEVPELLKQWGTFKADTAPIGKLGAMNAQAVRLMDRGGWL